MNKSPDYEEKSRAIAELCDNDVAIQAAREEIREALTESVRILKTLRTSSDEHIVLKACKEHLLLAGLYVERSEVKNQGSLNVTISGEHAEKVLNASK